MLLEMKTLSPMERYRVLSSTVTPRPIAWVTSVSTNGVPNASPFSFFNMVGNDPPLLAIGFLADPFSGKIKDTPTNILATGEFVVNLVSENDAEAMNVTSADAPPEIDELELAAIDVLPSLMIRPNRIASAPVNFECRKFAVHEWERQLVVLGEILVAHIRDEFVTDRDRVRFDIPAMNLIGRVQGSGTYLRNSDQFDLKRPSYDMLKT